MTSRELATLLMKNPDTHVLLKIGNEWMEVCGVKGTEMHRNAVTFKVENENLGGGVIVVSEDIPVTNELK